MPLQRDDVEQALTGKFGLVLRRRRGADHRYYDLLIDGRRVAWTFVSTGTGHRTIGDDIVSQMAKQMSVNRSFFVEMIRCTRSRDDFIGSLRESGYI